MELNSKKIWALLISAVIALAFITLPFILNVPLKMVVIGSLAFSLFVVVLAFFTIQLSSYESEDTEGQSKLNKALKRLSNSAGFILVISYLVILLIGVLDYFFTKE